MNNKTKPNRETVFEKMILRTLDQLPPELRKWALKKIIFVYQSEESPACSVHKNRWKHHEGLVCLFDDLLNKKEANQDYSILHEIAHIKLKHVIKEDTETMKKIEKEAHDLAWDWWTKARTEMTLKKLRSEI